MSEVCCNRGNVLQKLTEKLPETKNRARTSQAAPLAADPVQSARLARLRYVTDAMPGIRRKPVGKHFGYVGVDGKPIHDESELQRIRRLAIPPAWTDVWICPLAHGHLQATGRDARGRKQYRYHPRWREVHDEVSRVPGLLYGLTLTPWRGAPPTATIASTGDVTLC
jgi:DNA topoisomerase-1